MTLHDRTIAAIRTYVPYVITAALAYIYTSTAVDLRGDFQVALIAVTSVGVTNLYYLLIRLIETKLPWIGVLLGWPKAPEYEHVENLWASLVRTGIPTVAGALVFIAGYWVAELLGITIPADVSAQVVVFLIAVLEVLYHAAAVSLASRWSGLAWMLGGTMPPEYSPPRHRA